MTETFVKERNGVLYTADLDGLVYRYRLGRIWGSGPALVAIGLNPSRATHERDDATIRVLMGYAKKLNFAELLMLNLYAWRATKPRDMLAAARRGEHVIGPRNHFEHLQMYIAEKTRLGNSCVVIAAWGSHGRDRGYDFCRYMGRDFCDASLKALAVNKDGSPHHPLHISLTGALHPYPGEASFWE